MKQHTCRTFCTLSFFIVLIPLCTITAVAFPRTRSQDTLRQEALNAMRRAAGFFRTQVARHGGYVWQYSADLKKREGEGKVGESTAWVQPPGTPTVGVAYLRAYQATGDQYYLESAREAASALIKGQLRSGGWTYRIEFDPAERKRFAYRVDPPSKRARNVTTLDDNTTQEGVRFLMRLDKALEFRDEAVHQASLLALNSLLRAQYPTGAWPQGFDQFPDPDKFPIRRASYPPTWPRSVPANNDYWHFYTLNDNVLADMIDVMFEAASVYEDKKYRQSALKAADFLLLAQMPDPQPAWAQQYDFEMHPTWARKFEPPAVTGGESQRVMEILLRVYRETGEKKYLEPIPRAIAYLRKVQLPNGQLPRFYELKTNRPLYFTRKYELTYSDDDLPTHYSFKVSNRVDSIMRAYERLVKTPVGELKSPSSQERKLTAALRSQVREIVNKLDDKGCWVENGRLRYHGAQDTTDRIITSRTFVRNMQILSTYLELSRRPD